MSATGNSPVDLASLANAAKEKLDAHTYEIVQWHFHESTGSPFWLQKKREYSTSTRSRK